MVYSLYKLPVFVTFGAGGGSGLVTSINGETGDVTLDASDIESVPDRNYVTDAELALIHEGGGGEPSGQYASVSELIAAVDVTVGDIVSTLGYYVAGDLGAAVYEVVSANTAVADNANYIDLTASGLQARLITNGIARLEQFGAVSDGVTSAVNGLLAANASQSKLCLSAGSYLIDQTISIDMEIFSTAGIFRIEDDVTLTLPAPNVKTRQIFDVVGSGKVQLSSGTVAYPEWWGGGATAIQKALDQSWRGSTVLLQAQTYMTTGIVIDGDESLNTHHFSKSIAGTKTATVDAQTGDTIHGTCVKLADGANTNIVSIVPGNNPAKVHTKICEMTLDCNASGQSITTLDGVHINGVNGVRFENIEICDAPQDGMVFSGPGCSADLAGKISVKACGRDGVVGTDETALIQHGVLSISGNQRRGVNIGLDVLLKADRIEALANGEEGLYWNSESTSFISYLVCMDNGLAGLHYSGDDLRIGTLVAPDNGVNATAARSQAGVSDEGEHLWISNLVNPVRNDPSVTHNQKTLFFANGIGAIVERVNDHASEENQIGGGRCLYLRSFNRNLLSPKFLERRVFDGDMSAHQAIASGFRPLEAPDIYGVVNLKDIDADITVFDTNASRSAYGSEWHFRFGCSANSVLNWGDDYFDQNGTPLGATNMIAGQVYDFVFVRRAGIWKQIA